MRSLLVMACVACAVPAAPAAWAQSSKGCTATSPRGSSVRLRHVAAQNGANAETVIRFEATAVIDGGLAGSRLNFQLTALREGEKWAGMVLTKPRFRLPMPLTAGDGALTYELTLDGAPVAGSDGSVARARRGTEVTVTVTGIDAKFMEAMKQAPGGSWAIRVHSDGVPVAAASFPIDRMIDEVVRMRDARDALWRSAAAGSCTPLTQRR